MRFTGRLGQVIVSSMFGFDAFSVRYFAFIHSQTEAAIGVGASPRLKDHRSAFLTIIREWNESAIVALLALRQLHHRASSTDQASVPKANVSEEIC
jgi:hypothetical protein